ncbi:alanyl-tRNA editing protein [Jannaschia sp. 2305UL9-9]|uniref:alanyl-tRNA editing protein n=1 Tax=Jannaschia sp. 2305UL9-9 TaxID=3121638 RepID=UPI003529B370
MTTEALFHADPYLKTATAEIIARTEEGGVVVDRSIFYPRGGGQPGDSGRIVWAGGSAEIASTVKTPDGLGAILVPSAPAPMPVEGTEIEMLLDWDRRHRFMRMHTALHLLSVVVPLPVTGGQIGLEKSRLDFDMPEVIHDRDFIQARMTSFVEGDHPVTDTWITDAQLDANPGLVKTLTVKPPRGAGKVRLVRIGAEENPVDLQPCGGTHVRSTGEIGAVRVGKIESKGRANRRISITLEG